MLVAFVEPPGETVPTAMAIGRFQNQAGSTYRLVSVKCWLDGAVVYEGASPPGDRLFARGLKPGQHSVSVEARYAGNGGGVFSYMDGYLFKVRGGRGFNVRQDVPANVVVRAFERGGPTSNYEKRLTIAVAVQ